jgi:hypothetical protein
MGRFFAYAVRPGSSFRKTDSPAFELLSLSLLSRGAAQRVYRSCTVPWALALRLREGSSHIALRGTKSACSSSDDGCAFWENGRRSFSCAGTISGDPKFARAPGGGIDLVMARLSSVDGKPAGRHSVVARSADGVSWAPPVRIADEGDWVWRV